MLRCLPFDVSLFYGKMASLDGFAVEVPVEALE